MTPDQIQAISAIASIINQIGTWPIGTIIVAIVFGPWIIMGLISRSIEKRHSAVIEMYKNNVKLVEHYEKMSAEQADTIRLSTAATTELTTYLRNRMSCREILAAQLRSME
ncbi:MAG: hypothetical protein ABSC11_02235 [Smithella sp.]|jgi:hypothetical protein